MSKQTHLVWDLPIRIFHWLLVCLIAAQWLLAEFGEQFFQWHFYLGYTTLGLIMFRIIWGFMGTRYARFNQFIASPKSTLNYIKSPQSTSIGHNPLGALMVVLMLILILLQAISGLFVDDDIFFAGPYAHTLGGNLQNIMQWLHGNVFDLILLCIVAHIAAIVFYKFVKKQNLTLAMFTGKKAISVDSGISSSQLLKAVILVCICVACVSILIYFAPVVEDEWY